MHRSCFLLPTLLIFLILPATPLLAITILNESLVEPPWNVLRDEAFWEDYCNNSTPNYTNYYALAEADGDAFLYADAGIASGDISARGGPAIPPRSREEPAQVYPVAINP